MNKECLMSMPKTTKIYFLDWATLRPRIGCLIFISKKCWYRDELHNFSALTQSHVTYRWETLDYTRQEKLTSFILTLKHYSCFRHMLMVSTAMLDQLKCCRFNFTYFGWIGKIGLFKIVWPLLTCYLSSCSSIGFTKSQDKDSWKPSVSIWQGRSCHMGEIIFSEVQQL